MPTQPRTRIAAFVSGGGSNFVAVHEFQRARGEVVAGEVVLVVSNKSGCGALARAIERGITCAVLANPRDGDALLSLLREHNIEVLVLAGCRLWPIKRLNATLAVHPRSLIAP